MPDPRVVKRIQLIAEELTICERTLSDMQNRIAGARMELAALLQGPVPDAHNGTITWQEFKTKVRVIHVGLQIVTRGAGVLAARWNDYLMLTDQNVQLKHESEKRKYKVALENLDNPPMRPQTLAPMAHMVYPGR